VYKEDHTQKYDAESIILRAVTSFLLSNVKKLRLQIYNMK